MKKVTGIGGIFFKSTDPGKMSEWYTKHLGIEMSENNNFIFEWRDKENPETIGQSVLAAFPAATTYFQPSTQNFMINYRVENLESLMEQLKESGVEVLGNIESYSYGKFGWILDPEGNKIELWEPVEEVPNIEGSEA